MGRNKALACLALIAGTALADPAPRIWLTGFERESDAAGFYITPQAHLGTSFHGLQSEQKYSGDKAHAAWIKGANNTWLNADSNHRAYPTIQLHKLPGGWNKRTSGCMPIPIVAAVAFSTMICSSTRRAVLSLRRRVRIGCRRSRHANFKKKTHVQETICRR